MKKNVARLKQVIEVLNRRHNAPIRELAQLLDVSEMTVRRDLEILKDRNIVMNVRGLVMLNSRFDAETDGWHYSLRLAANLHLKEKERIGAYAASLVEEDDCIIIDNGTTTERLARNLPPNLRITVLTTNLNIINCLCNNPNVSLILSGGYFHNDTTLFESQEGVSLINKTRANKVFVSTSGVHQTMGVTCANSYELTIKRAILESGANRILLTDSSKFGLIRTTFFAKLEDFDKIVTDRNLSGEWADSIRDQKTELVTL
ncbi:MAG: DeoR/GlpR family DNA-binding transcription regulator [Synergistaceae bacterium]|nr:DeoR/GlpR family DNA-binding transcription regulator [Synergistaceae bacterium]